NSGSAADELKKAMTCSLAGRPKDYSGGIRICLKFRNGVRRELFQPVERHGTVLTRLQAYRLAGVLAHDRCDSFRCQFSRIDLHFAQLCTHPGSLGRALRRQIDRAGGKINSKGDDARYKKQQQADTVQYDDAYIQSTGRLPATLRIEYRSAGGQE